MVMKISHSSSRLKVISLRLLAQAWRISRVPPRGCSISPCSELMASTVSSSASRIALPSVLGSNAIANSFEIFDEHSAANRSRILSKSNSFSLSINLYFTSLLLKNAFEVVTARYGAVTALRRYRKLSGPQAFIV